MVKLKINVYSYSRTLSSKLLSRSPAFAGKQGSFVLKFGVSQNGGAARMCEVDVLRNSADARTKTHKEVHFRLYPGFDVAEVTLRRYTFVWLNILL